MAQLIVSLSMFGAGVAEKAKAAAGSFPMIDPGELDSWLRIDSSGHVWAFTGRVDQGQRKTAFAQTGAEELDVRVGSVTVVLGDTDRVPNQRVRGA